MISRKDYLVLFLIGLLVSIAAAVLQPVPGYMDAEYYYSNGVRWADGEGGTEMVLWNYLDDPAGLPHPSHTYWMPLPSLVAAAGMLLASSRSFFSAQLFFILLAAILPGITALLAHSLGQDRGNCMLAGLLAAFPGFYVVYTTNTETFTLYMLLGSLFLLIAFWNSRSFIKYLLLGIIAGLMHLTRAEGMIWLLPGGLVCIYDFYFEHRELGFRQLSWNIWRKLSISFLIMFASYILVMSPWFYRNIALFGSLTAPGGSKTVWLTNYDQTFTYHPERLNFQTWMEAGWKYHLDVRLDALVANLKNFVAVQSEVFLLPMILIGAWHSRKKPQTWLAVGMWLLLLFAMTVVFPFSGARGGFIHSCAAVQPFLWALAPIGLDQLIAIGQRLRNWEAEQAKIIFGSGLMLIALILTGALFSMRVIGDNFSNPVWRVGWDEHSMLEEALDELGAVPADTVMVNNPPGYYAVSARPSIVIPNGDETALLAAASRYGAKYLILQCNHVNGLNDLYENPGDRPGLVFLKTVEDAYIYQLQLE